MAPRRIATTATLVLSALLHASASLAQGTDTGSGLAQERRGASIDGTASGAESPVHVGAGTTSASTTGYSGRGEEKSPPSRQFELPPLPDAGLCDAYRDRPGFDGCLGIVLPRKTGTQQ